MGHGLVGGDCPTGWLFMRLWTRGALREVDGDPTWHTRVVRNLFEVDCTRGMILCWLTLECDSGTNFGIGLVLAGNY